MSSELSTEKQLHAELTALFGAPRRYHEFWSWSLGQGQGLEVHLYAHCPVSAAACELWIVDPRLPNPGPQLLAQVDSPASVRAAIERLHLLVDERTSPTPAEPRIVITRRWDRLRAGRRRR